MALQAGCDELLRNMSFLAADLLPALAVPTVALVISAATMVGWNGPDLAERLFGKLSRWT